MALPREHGAGRTTPRREIARQNDELEAIRRDHVETPQPQGLVLIREQRSETWQNGVAWLKVPGEV
jgi:hypothetical protein